MRISYLAATILATGLLSVSTSASASCGGTVCSSGSAHGSHGAYTSRSSHGSHSSHSNHASQSNHGSYGSHSSYSSSTSYAPQSPCPTGSNRDSSGLCMSNSNGSSYSSSTSYSSATNYSSASPRVVPFTTSVSNISEHRVNGMGANEYLSKTNCPTSVYNPEGGKVLGCYSVVKPKPVYVQPAPVRVTVPTYNTVRVVRPIIYVRYPVPVAVPVYQQFHGYQQYSSCAANSYSRYGENWPGRGCR